MSAPKWDRLILARNGALENEENQGEPSLNELCKSRDNLPNS